MPSAVCGMITASQRRLFQAMDATGKRMLASVISPIPVVIGLELLLNFESHGHSGFSLLGFPTVIAYIWFAVGLLPFVLRWRLKNVFSLLSLMAIGAFSASAFFMVVLYFFLSMLGHGGTDANLGEISVEVLTFAALSGAAAAALFGSIYGLLAGHEE